MKGKLCVYEVMETMLYFPFGTVLATCLHAMAEAPSPDTPEPKRLKESAPV